MRKTRLLTPYVLDLDFHIMKKVSLLFAVATLTVSIFAFARFDYQWQLVFGQGKYKSQSEAYSLAVKKELTTQQLCSSDFECPPHLEFYGDSSLLIEREIYNIEGNELILTKYLNAAFTSGQAAAGGVPIKIIGYKKPRKYYINRDSEHIPYLIIEIK